MAMSTMDHVSIFGQNIELYASLAHLLAKSIDEIISLENISLFEKKMLISKILEHDKYLEIKINTYTMTKLLEIKEESVDFLEIYILIIRCAADRNTNIFTYEHLYHLVLQSWMDIPFVISSNFKQQLIAIALNGFLPNNFIEKIAADSSDWFDNLQQSGNLLMIVDWLCHFDKMGHFYQIKNRYLEETKLQMIESKLFLKMHNITKDEYNIQQLRAKKNGLCKFIREKRTCENGQKCKFYHGKIEETYGIQSCRHGLSCSHFLKGECKFAHDPSQDQFHTTSILYKSLMKYRNGFLVLDQDFFMIERERKNNPFVILKLESQGKAGNYYVIPTCQCATNGTCNELVKFITHERGWETRYYCSYDHMIQCQPNVPYQVKQNILKKIFPNILI